MLRLKIIKSKRLEKKLVKATITVLKHHQVQGQAHLLQIHLHIAAHQVQEQLQHQSHAG